MSRVAIFTDSASDMDAAEAASLGVTVIPLLVSFGNETFRAGTELSTDAFWQRMTAADAPFPKTAASSPGEFKEAYEAAFAAGAGSIVSVHVAGTLSGTIKSAQIARDMLPDREIHIVDSTAVSMAQGLLCRMAAEMAADDRSAEDIAATLESRTPDLHTYVALETLEYLKKGGRISGTQAAIGTLLSVKPIIMVKDGAVETVDKVRTRGKARERLMELMVQRPIERLSILHSNTPDVGAFRDEVLRRLPDLDKSKVSTELVGASVGPHIGPGCVGVVVLYKPGG